MTNTIYYNKKIIHLIGFLFFLTLSFMSIHFFRERILQNDNVYYAFRIIQDGKYDIEHGRKVNVVTQFLPLMAMKMGFSVSTVVKLYSISFVLFIYAFFLLIVLVFKDYNTGLALIASTFLVIRYIFYLPVAEFYQGCLVSLTLWSYLYTYKEGFKIKWLWYVFPVVCILVTPWFHLLNYITVAFVLFLFFLEAKSSQKCIILFLVFFSIGYINYKLIPATSYEMNKIPMIKDIFERMPLLLKTDTGIYIKKFLSHHPPFLIALVLLVIMGIWKRKILILLYSLFCIGAFIIFILFTLPPFESPFVYENYLCCIGLLICLPLFIIIRPISWKIQSIISFGLFLLSVQVIYNAHYPVTERIKYISRLCNYGKNFPEKRYIIETTNYPWKVAWTTFSLPFETLLYQAVEDPTNPITFTVTNGISRFDSVRKDESFFLAPEWDIQMFNHEQGRLNEKYFKLPNLGYRSLSSSQDDSTFNESMFTKENLKLTLLRKSFCSGSEPFIVVPVKIENLTLNILHSLRAENNSIAFAYHIKNDKGEVVVGDGERTPLEVDVINEYTQGVFVWYPKKRGKYIVNIDLVTENKRWWGYDCAIELEVK